MEMIVQAAYYLISRYLYIRAFINIIKVGLSYEKGRGVVVEILHYHVTY